MVTEISKLKPVKLWQFFKEICSIPHPSKHEEQIVEFVKSTGEQFGLETHVDGVGNVIIRKPATPGYEQLQMVTLQSHLDMVPQKNSLTAHDFKKHPIKPYIDGDWVTAQDTTLGADNGIGVAATLAVLSDDTIKHGPIEALFTIDEETGMTGAFNLAPGLLKGKYLLNLDSEDEGELYIGCAGGVTTSATFHYEPTELPDDYSCFKLSMTGFKGGHSGVDIHLERGNPNQEMARLLYQAVNECDAHVCSINGGTLRNAIPREAFAIIAVPRKKYSNLTDLIASFTEILKSELTINGQQITIECEKHDSGTPAVGRLLTKNILKSIITCPNGVQRTNQEMEGIVEASSNIGIIETTDNTIEVNTLQRASRDSLRELEAERVRHTFELAGAQVTHTGEYPGWTPQPDSLLLSILKTTYESEFGKQPKELVIHAGLECGIIHSNYPQMEMISFGPTIRFPHSPGEKVNISSVEKFWLFLLKTLISMPQSSPEG